MEELVDHGICQIRNRIGSKVPGENRLAAFLVISEGTCIHCETVDKFVIRIRCVRIIGSSPRSISHGVRAFIVADDDRDVSADLVVLNRLLKCRELFNQKIDRLRLQSIDNELCQKIQIGLGQGIFGILVAVDIDDVGIAGLFFFLRSLFFLSRFFFLLGSRFLSLFLRGLVLSFFLVRRYLVSRDDLVAAGVSRILDGAFLSVQILELGGKNISDPGLALIDGDDLVLAKELEQVFGEGDLVAAAGLIIISDRVLFGDNIGQYRKVASFSGEAGVGL